MHLQAQIVGLAVQIAWTANVELALTEARGQDTTPLQKVMGIIEGSLNVLADCVLQEQPFIRRKKLEYLVSVPLGTVHLYIVGQTVHFVVALYVHTLYLCVFLRSLNWCTRRT